MIRLYVPNMFTNQYVESKIDEINSQLKHEWELYDIVDNNYTYQNKNPDIDHLLLQIHPDDNRMVFHNVETGDYIKMTLNDDLKIVVEQYLKNPEKAYQYAKDKEWSKVIKNEDAIENQVLEPEETEEFISFIFGQQGINLDIKVKDDHIVVNGHNKNLKAYTGHGITEDTAIVESYKIEVSGEEDRYAESLLELISYISDIIIN